MRTKIIFKLSFLFFFFSLASFSQESYWKKINNNNFITQNKELYHKKNSPKKYNLYSLDLTAITGQLNNRSASKNIVYLPNAEGEITKYLLKEASNLDPKLAQKFPMIKSYSAQGIDDPTAFAKISVGTDGFHAAIFSGHKSTVYIDPYTKDNQEYLVYKKNSLNDQVLDFTCEVEEVAKKSLNNNNVVRRTPDDGRLRTFRLALVCSGEYAQFHLNNQGIPVSATDSQKKAAVLSAMNTTMNRVNGVFERDLSVRMILVANNDDIIFLDSDTDDITNGSASAMIDQSQSICDSRIGSANYDIGHLFGTNGSGLAGLGVVCVNGQKGSGITATAQPIGDPFDIDFVAHEMGHQFGAQHTQNNECNRNNSTAVEPGSASTIMGYAGICAPNVQSNSDDHFHAISIEEMWSTIQNSATCGNNTTTDNTAPVADAGLDYTIPRSTPFVLRGSATDVDGTSSLTYNWEQIDNETAQMPPLSTNTVGPAFRSLPSTTSPNRYMPSLATVISGSTASTWEVVPSVSRDMNFAFTVRDNNSGGGGLGRDDMRVTVDDSAGPFVVTSQTNNVTWNVGSSQEITWDVAGTDVGSVNTPTVNILLSHDGGQTFPVTLASDVPNDGSHTITVPQIGGGSSQVRIMVEGNNNIFYAVNSSNFTIEESEFALALDNAVVNTCTPNSAVFTFTYNTFLGFNGTTNFSAINLPANAIVNFNPSSASSDGTQVSLTITGIENVAIGSYPFQVQGESGNIISAASATVNVYNNNLSTPTLNVPSDGQTSVSLTPTLQWSSDVNVASYDLEVATDVSFNTVVLREIVSSNSYTIRNSLSSGTAYYWRVRPSNTCLEGNFSNTSSFTTTSCTVCSSVANVAFQTSTTRVIFNTIDNSSSKTLGGYSDYRNISTNVQRGEDYNLSVQVNTDGEFTTQTLVWIDWNQDCDFDDVNETYDLGTATNVANGVTSSSPLNISIPLDASLGSTIMRVSTKYAGDGSPTSCENGADAEVEDYSIVVQDVTASIEDFAFEGFNLYPNPTQGAFTIRFKTISSENVLIRIMDIAGRTVFANTYQNVASDFSERVMLENISSGIYLLQIQNGNKQTTRKLLIE